MLETKAAARTVTGCMSWALAATLIGCGPPADDTVVAKFTTNRASFDEIQQRECALDRAVIASPGWRESRAAADEKVWLSSKLKVIGGTGLAMNAAPGPCQLVITVWWGDKQTKRFRFGSRMPGAGTVTVERALGDDWWLEDVTYS